MFEGRKIKNLLNLLTTTEDNAEQTKLISQITGYGKTAFSYTIDAFKNRRITYIQVKPILEKIYDKSFLNDLINLTSDSYDVVRGLAKEIVINKGGEEAISKSIANLEQSDVYLKTSAVDILIGMKSQSCVLKLISVYNKGNNELKKNIVNILSEIGGQTAGRLLINALKEKDWSIRIRAVRGISRMKDPMTVEPMIDLLSEKDPQMKKTALDTLCAFGDKRATRPILNLLKDSDLMIRQKSVDFLCQFGDSTIITEILKLMRDDDVNVRRCSVEILNNLKDPQTGEALVKAMKDSDWWVREVATDALAEIKGENVVRILKAMLKDADENIRRCAVEFFNKVTDPSAVEPLIEILEDEDWWVREKAVSALGRLKDKKAVPAMSKLIDDEEIKWVVPSALVQIGGKEVVAPLINFLNDHQKKARIEGFRALGIIKDEETVPAIKEFLGDPDEEIRDEAVRALKKITGKVFRTNEGKPPKKKSQNGWALSGASLPEGSLLSEAILVLDLVNSTGIADKYGNQFALELTGVLTNIANPIAEQEKFQYIKSTGDGFLITFPTTKNAIRFAFRVLREISDYNSSVEGPKVIDLRFAINFGETRVDAKGDRLSLATNMTFRVEGVKADGLIPIEGGLKKEEMPGNNRIFVTENIAEDTAKMEGVKTRLIGLFELKGISGLHRVFEISDK